MLLHFRDYLKSIFCKIMKIFLQFFLLLLYFLHGLLIDSFIGSIVALNKNVQVEFLEEHEVGPQKYDSNNRKLKTHK